MTRRFDLALAFPQWQGSGRHENLPRGARSAAEACARFAPLVHVPLVGDGTQVDGVNRWSAILEQFRTAQDLLRRHAPRRVLTAGGDCSIDVAAIDYLRRLYPDLTVLWVDAHLDANTPVTSPSGNFHGMPVAALLGRPPVAMREHLAAPLDPTRFRYSGIRVGDDGDWAFQREHGLATLAHDERLGGPVHIHFDLDVLDPVEFPHVAYPEGALPVAAAIELIRRVARDADIVGLTITEFAPDSDEAARDGQGVIARLCQAADA
jgi:arginase